MINAALVHSLTDSIQLSAPSVRQGRIKISKPNIHARDAPWATFKQKKGKHLVNYVPQVKSSRQRVKRAVFSALKVTTSRPMAPSRVCSANRESTNHNQARQAASSALSAISRTFQGRLSVRAPGPATTKTKRVKPRPKRVLLVHTKISEDRIRASTVKQAIFRISSDKSTANLVGQGTIRWELCISQEICFNIRAVCMRTLPGDVTRVSNDKGRYWRK